MTRARQKTFAKELKKYFDETLHSKVEIKVIQTLPQNLPRFLRDMYAFYSLQIGGRQAIILASRKEVSTPATIAKHVHLVRASTDLMIVFAAPALSAYHRARFIAGGIAFVVPGNQLYVPELAVDLKEHFLALRTKPTNGLSPAAQAILFHHILRIDEQATTPSAIARKLHYTPMTIGRVFHEFEAFQLAHIEKKGKEKHLCFDKDRRELFELSLPLLHSPVRAVKYIQKVRIKPWMKWAGEMALAELTGLSQPHLEIFALPAREWRTISHDLEFVEVKKYMAELVIETWSYDPSGLSDSLTVDPLSLFVQFRNHQDERIAIAAEKLLETIPW